MSPQKLLHLCLPAMFCIITIYNGDDLWDCDSRRTFEVFGIICETPLFRGRLCKTNDRVTINNWRVYTLARMCVQVHGWDTVYSCTVAYLWVYVQRYVLKYIFWFFLFLDAHISRKFRSLIFLKMLLHIFSN